ncbi:YciI family protein [Rhodococcus sp. ARC_M6]|uniref:YciI family protein n=1 Tax=Rhodococcus sp. ARC_M6 TaxID=2928852 RepID=UPI001FB403F5|nr:YciI family protein [Rhodococcus sp. ARC_M6]MCJ0902736.1 YciI family protein [Rhodococcus sp. ARC_M6]
MSLFLVEYTYAPEKNAARDAIRADHRAWLTDLLERDIVLSSGPFADGLGALIIVDTADAETVALLFTHDPFAIADLIANVRITEWVPVLGQFSG